MAASFPKSYDRTLFVAQFSNGYHGGVFDSVDEADANMRRIKPDFSWRVITMTATDVTKWRRLTRKDRK